MRNYSNNNSSGGGKSGVSIGFVGLLQLAFIILKLCNVINWSWWVVLIPLWIEIILIVGLIAFTVWLYKK